MNSASALGLLLPVALFAAGAVLRATGLLKPRHAGFMLAVVVNLGLPMLMLGAISRVSLDAGYVALPLLGPLVLVMALVCAMQVGRRMHLPRPTLAAFAIATASINVSFEIPFVAAAWGTQALAQLLIFDIGNAIVYFTLVYGFAAYMGGHRASLVSGAHRVLSFPPLWALAVALAINIWRIPVPDLLLSTAQQAGQLLLLLIVVAMGAMLEPRHLLSRPVLVTVATRSLLGLLIASLFTSLVSIEGMQRSVMLVAASAPIGFSTVAIAHREQLDAPFAAAAASLSALLAVVWLPLALVLFQP